MNNKKSTHRKKQSLATHKKIYQTSLTLFSKKGYDRVTISEICRKSGVSLGTFYIHFKSKDAVIMEHFMAINKLIRDEVIPVLPEIDSRIDKLKFLCASVSRYMDNLGVDFIKVVMQSQISAGRKDPVMAAERGILFNTVLEQIDECLKVGILKDDTDATEITRFIMMSYRGILYEWCLKDGSFDLTAAGDRMVQTILYGLLA